MVRILIDKRVEGLLRLGVFGLAHQIEGILILLVGIGAGQRIGLIACCRLFVGSGCSSSIACPPGCSRGRSGIGILVELLLLLVVLALRHGPERSRLASTGWTCVASRLIPAPGAIVVLRQRRLLRRVVLGLRLPICRT